MRGLVIPAGLSFKPGYPVRPGDYFSRVILSGRAIILAGLPFEAVLEFVA